MSKVARMLLPAGVARNLCLQSGFYAIGSGVFLAGNAVFFTQAIGLSAQQVGIGLTVSGAISLALAVPLGAVADRVGPLRTWVLAAALEALVYLCYPFVGGFVGFLCAVMTIAIAESVGGAGRSAYSLDALDPATRVRSLAFMRTSLNIGFTVGAMLGGVALAVGTQQAILAIPLVAGSVMAANSFFIGRLPRTRHDAVAEKRPSALFAVRDRRFVLLALMNGVLCSHGVLFASVVPLWLVTRTAAPYALTAWLFVLNTVMAVSLQVWATRRVDTQSGPGRLLRMTGGAFIAGCIALMLAHGQTPVVASAALLLGAVCVTMAELWQSAASWTLLSRLAPPGQRGAYSGVWQIGSKLQSIIGPAGFTWLVITWSPVGWLVLGSLLAAFGLAAPAIIRWAESTSTRRSDDNGREACASARTRGAAADAR